MVVDLFFTFFVVGVHTMILQSGNNEHNFRHAASMKSLKTVLEIDLFPEDT